MAKSGGVRAEPALAISLPPLASFDGAGLEDHHEYEAVGFIERDFSGQSADDARFVDCRIERCHLDGVSMRRSRVMDCLLADVDATSIDLTASNWRGTHVTGGRFGAMVAPGAMWTGVRGHGVKLGFANLRGSRLENVVFEKCLFDELDVDGAQLQSVTFPDCTIDALNIAGAAHSEVDLSGARLQALRGVENLRGTIVSHAQLLDLAPLLAGSLGLRIRD